MQTKQCEQSPDKARTDKSKSEERKTVDARRGFYSLEIKSVSTNDTYNFTAALQWLKSLIN